MNNVTDEIFNKLRQELGKNRLEKNRDLTQFITLKTQVTARYFFEAKTREDLIKARKAATFLDIPLLLLGGGSNLVIIKSNLEHLVVKNNYIELKVVDETNNHVIICVSSGYPVSRLINEAIGNGWQGFEYHFGLPGTVGGAIFMNSKWTRPLTYFGDNLIKASLVDREGNEKIVDHQYFQFGYDYSILQKTNEILLEAWFKLPKQASQLLRQRANQAMSYRRQTQPIGQLTSGCFFRNISESDRQRLQLPTTSAGYLIDQVGLKGKRIGGFKISDKHANFIINCGGGKAKDLEKLLRLIKNKIKAQFGITLQEEVIII